MRHVKNGIEVSYKHDKRSCGYSKKRVIEHQGCLYRTFPEEYQVSNKGMVTEKVDLDPMIVNKRQTLHAKVLN